MAALKVLLLASVACLAPAVRAQVFVVGEKTATADLPTDFTRTDLPLPDARLSERGRRELERDLDAEQGFAHRALPMGPGLTLRANGPLQQSPEEYKKMIFTKGESSAAGDRVVITALTFKPDRIIIDVNGGPYEKHRFLKHVSFNDNPVVADTGQKATGARVTLVFEGGVPEVTAPEVKALLQPVLDFGVKTGVQAYADTLPEPIKKAIAQHDVLVGMDHRMVLAALGPPESKVREHAGDDPSQARYEEWIYGQVPKTIRFIRFSGDKVTQVKIAALGKPIEVHDQDEMSGFNREPVHEVAMGDATGGEESAQKKPPTLSKPGEVAVPGGQNRVQFPDAKPAAPASSSPAPAGVPAAGPDHLVASAF